MPDSEAFIDAVLAGDRDAFRHLVRLHKDSAWGIALSVLKDAFTARDAVQQAFVQAWLHLGSFRREASFRTWLHRIVIREALKLAKEQQQQQTADFADTADIPDPQPPESGGELRDAHQRYYINQALARLDTRESLVLKLFYLEAYSIREISQLTAWSESHVKVLLYRARRNMRVLLEKTFRLKPEDLYLP